MFSPTSYNPKDSAQNSLGAGESLQKYKQNYCTAIGIYMAHTQGRVKRIYTESA